MGPGYDHGVETKTQDELHLCSRQPSEREGRGSGGRGAWRGAGLGVARGVARGGAPAAYLFASLLKLMENTARTTRITSSTATPAPTSPYTRLFWMPQSQVSPLYQ